MTSIIDGEFLHLWSNSLSWVLRVPQYLHSPSAPCVNRPPQFRPSDVFEKYTTIVNMADAINMMGLAKAQKVMIGFHGLSESTKPARSKGKKRIRLTMIPHIHMTTL